MPQNNTIPIEQTQESKFFQTALQAVPDGLKSVEGSPLLDNTGTTEKNAGSVEVVPVVQLPPELDYLTDWDYSPSKLQYLKRCFNTRQGLVKWLRAYYGVAHRQGLMDEKKLDLFRKKITNLQKCGTHYMTIGCNTCDDKSVVNVPFRCKSRLCPECSAARQRSWVQKYLPALEKIPAHRIRHMTLTLVNSDDLYDAMVRIKKHFKALRAYHFKKEIEGGLVGFEAHLGKSGGRWNVHCHILYIGSYISQARLSSVWEKITGDSKVVDIRSIGRDFNCKWRNRKVSAQEHALNYITKYITKGVGVGLGGIPEFDSLAVSEWGTLDQWSKGSKVHSQFDFHKPSKQQVANWDIPALADLLIEGHKQKLAFAFGCLFGQAQLDEYELKCPKCGGDDVYLYNHKTCGVLWMKYPIEGFTVDDPELLHIAGQAMRDWEKERDKGKYADRHVYLGVSR